MVPKDKGYSSRKHNILGGNPARVAFPYCRASSGTVTQSHKPQQDAQALCWDLSSLCFRKGRACSQETVIAPSSHHHQVLPFTLPLHGKPSPPDCYSLLILQVPDQESSLLASLPWHLSHVTCLPSLPHCSLWPLLS